MSLDVDESQSHQSEVCVTFCKQMMIETMQWAVRLISCIEWKTTALNEYEDVQLPIDALLQLLFMSWRLALRLHKKVTGGREVDRPDGSCENLPRCQRMQVVVLYLSIVVVGILWRNNTPAEDWEYCALPRSSKTLEQVKEAVWHMRIVQWQWRADGRECKVRRNGHGSQPSKQAVTLGMLLEACTAM